MPSIKDDRGYNQGFKPSKALEIRTERRSKYISSEITKKGVDILEIGCGTGELTYFLARNTGDKVLGTDICVSFIKDAKKKYSLENLDFAILDFNAVEENNQIYNKKFDYIIGNGILHHLYFNIDDTLKELKLLLRKDGKIIFLEPNILNPYCLLIFKTKFGRKIANLEPSEMAFRKKFIFEKLENNGFTNVSVEYKDFLLPNIPEPFINIVITFGRVLEKLPLFKKLSQSIYITAQKGHQFEGKMAAASDFDAS